MARNKAIAGQKNLKYQYTSKGIVIGNCWGGGVVGYKATSYTDNSYKKIKARIAEGFNNGSLDSGMGFENLIGYKLTIKKETITKDNFIKTDYIECNYNDDDFLYDYED